MILERDATVTIPERIHPIDLPDYVIRQLPQVDMGDKLDAIRIVGGEPWAQRRAVCILRWYARRVTIGRER